MTKQFINTEERHTHLETKHTTILYQCCQMHSTKTHFDYDENINTWSI